MPSTFLRNTTALAVSLGLVLPQIAAAQPLPAAEAARIAQARAGNMPDLARMLDKEIRAGLTADNLGCLMNAPKPCPEGSALFTPGGIAVEMVEDGSFILAPAPRQVKRATGEGKLVPANGKIYGTPRTDAAAPGAPLRLAQADAVTATDALPLPPSDAAGADAAAAAAADAGAPVVAEEPAPEAAPVAEAAPAEPPAPPKAQADAPEADAAAEARAALQDPPAETQAEPGAVETPVVTAAPAADPPLAVVAAPEPEAPAAGPAKARADKARADKARADKAKAPAPAAEPADAAARADSGKTKDAAKPVVVAEPETKPARAKGDAPKPAAAKAANDKAAKDKAGDGKARDDKGRNAKARNDKADAARADAAGGPAVIPKAPDAPDASQSPSEADLARALAERSGEAETVPAPGAAPVVGGADAAARAAEPPASQGKGAPDAAAADAARAAVPSAPETGGGAAPVVVGGGAKGSPAGPSDDELAAALAGARAVPEADARPTDAAREAAAAAIAPAAAALAETAAPVVTTDKRQVTTETSRSATEDFATDVRGALRGGDIPVVGGAQGSGAPVVVGADGQPVTTGEAQTADRDDDRSDLEKVLRQAVLPALAGLAVGQLLSNNRQVELNTGDRVVVTRPDGSQEILKDDNALLLRPGSTVQTEEYADGSTRTIVTREDGSQVVTIRDADLRVLRRTLVRPDGTTTALIDETVGFQPVDVATLPPPARPVVVAPGEQLSETALREALRRETQVDRAFTLGQIRNIPEVRALVAPVDIQAITFDTGSAAIKPDQAQALASLGRVIADSVRQNPGEVFMIEGYTDTVGSGAMNLALSDRRAESVALALTEFFGVPPENMVVQGYGEQFLKVPQEGDIRANRRASVRRITDLLARS